MNLNLLRSLIIAALLGAGLLGAACSSDSSSTSDTDTGQSDVVTEADAALAPPWDPDIPLGGERPAEVRLPEDYDTSRAWPLVVMLHGYSASASVQDAYFGLSRRRDEHGFILVLPDGTRDNSGNRFWNATDACCNFNAKNVDDVEYLSGLLAEAKERLAVDHDRVYFIGHSNGGFMSYRMACELGSEITAIASLAGSSFGDAQDCAENGQLGVLQIHGDADTTVLYEGGHFFGNPYPGAREVVERWAQRNGCDAQPQDGESIDADNGVAGDETAVESWQGCDGDRRVELWTIEGGGHIPGLTSDFTDRVLDFLWAHEG